MFPESVGFVSHTEVVKKLPPSPSNWSQLATTWGFQLEEERHWMCVNCSKVGAVFDESLARESWECRRDPGQALLSLFVLFPRSHRRSVGKNGDYNVRPHNSLWLTVVCLSSSVFFKGQLVGEKLWVASCSCCSNRAADWLLSAKVGTIQDFSDCKATNHELLLLSIL